MIRLKSIFSMAMALTVVALFTHCEDELLTSIDQPVNINAKGPGGGGKGGKGGGRESVGNNLSFPVIWSEGRELTLREAPAGIVDVLLTGTWWYVWGEDPIDPQAEIYSCQPSPTDESICIDQTSPGDGISSVYKAYLQKDVNNYWKAYNAPATETLYVDYIDWGDNLESVDWSIVSKVRTEVVLIENLNSPVLEYAMRHVSGWGTDEVHGLQTDLEGNIQYGSGNQATVYSYNARLTIQKLNVDKTSPELANLTWDTNTHSWIDGELVNEPIFNEAVYKAGDGPGFYNAEVNVKGKIIYGYTWDVKKLNEGAGDYRITFSFDESVPGVALNTYFNDNTEIVMPIEEIVAAEEGGGGTAMIDVPNNLTYIDVTIAAGGGGGKGKPAR